MCRQIMASPLHMCSGFPMEKVEQMIVMSLDDVTVISHALWGREVYKESTHEPWGCHLGIWH